MDTIGTSDEYYLPQNKWKIKNLAEKIIAYEAPISRKLLMKKVLNAWSITRGGSKVESIFLDAMNTIPTNITADEERTFIWKKDQMPEQYEIYRVDSEETNKRSIDDISSYEILNAVTEVLCEQISLSETDLIKETAKKFGYSRTGGVIESTVKYAIQKGISLGRLIVSDKGNISLSE